MKKKNKKSDGYRCFTVKKGKRKGKRVCIKDKRKSKLKVKRETLDGIEMLCKTTKNGRKLCQTGKGVSGWSFVG